MKKVLNFFGIVLAVLFSLALIPTLILNPVWRGVSDLMEPEFLQGVVGEMMEEIDLSELALQDPDLMQTITDSGRISHRSRASWHRHRQSGRAGFHRPAHRTGGVLFPDG